ncbi:hypothetical protein JXL19_02600 [bacterium]|nr:hypothetical protein [bacterium]
MICNIKYSDHKTEDGRVDDKAIKDCKIPHSYSDGRSSGSKSWISGEIGHA